MAQSTPPTADTTPGKAAALAAFRHIVGDAYVLTEGDLSAYTHDWRKRAKGQALAVVRPGNTNEVAAVVAVCDAHAIAIVPQGGNTGLVVGSVPDESGTQIVLSLGRMNRIRAIDPENLTVTVEAGCVLQTLQEAVAEAGFYFPLSLAAEGSCTIGGNLGTNAGGTQVLRFGNARELCLGLEAVTAQGEVWNGLSGLRKDNTGYDLRHLLIGSEGTLGIITPINGQPATYANGGTIGLTMQSQAEVDAFHSAGVANGGVTCEDPPGVREGPSGKMYLAYLRDPDGTKFCAVYRYAK